jgi:hypothetical protein
MSARTEEIRARVEAARPQESWATERVGLIVTHAEPNILTKIWYDDGDLCAEVHDNLALGCDADALAQLFANAVDDIPYLLTELTVLREENERLKGDDWQFLGYGQDELRRIICEWKDFTVSAASPARESDHVRL